MMLLKFMPRSTPKPRHKPSDRTVALPQTFALSTERQRLTPTALKAIRNLSTAWRLTGDDAAALVGVSPSTWDRINAQGWKQTLSQDQLTRISVLVGIFKGLRLLFADDMPTAGRAPRTAGRSSRISHRSRQCSRAAFRSCSTSASTSTRCAAAFDQRQRRR